jgi:hypothetical protein
MRLGMFSHAADCSRPTMPSSSKRARVLARSWLQPLSFHIHRTLQQLPTCLSDRLRRSLCASASTTRRRAIPSVDHSPCPGRSREVDLLNALAELRGLQSPILPRRSIGTQALENCAAARAALRCASVPPKNDFDPVRIFLPYWAATVQGASRRRLQRILLGYERA